MMSLCLNRLVDKIILRKNLEEDDKQDNDDDEALKTPNPCRLIDRRLTGEEKAEGKRSKSRNYGNNIKRLIKTVCEAFLNPSGFYIIFRLVLHKHYYSLYTMGCRRVLCGARQGKEGSEAYHVSQSQLRLFFRPAHCRRFQGKNRSMVPSKIAIVGTTGFYLQFPPHRC